LSEDIKKIFKGYHSPPRIVNIRKVGFPLQCLEHKSIYLLGGSFVWRSRLSNCYSSASLANGSWGIKKNLVFAQLASLSSQASYITNVYDTAYVNLTNLHSTISFNTRQTHQTCKVLLNLKNKTFLAKLVQVFEQIW
jgi:hypothetical protein